MLRQCALHDLVTSSRVDYATTNRGSSTLFWQDLAAHADRSAFIDQSGNVLSYTELAEAADAFGGQPSQLILLELDHSLAAMVAYVAALRRRMPAIVINAGDADAATRLIDTFRPAFHWSPACGLKSLSPSGPALHPDLAIMLSTSGTTGTTKLVRLSAQAVNSNARSIVEYLAINCDDVTITTLPLGYSYGLSVVNSHLAAGATCILNSVSVVDAGFRAQIEKYLVTSLAGVPYTYELLERCGFLNDVPSSIRTMTQAGGKLPADRAQSIGVIARANGWRFFIMYGQTEATARMAYLPPEHLAAHPDCIGLAIPGGRLDLLDPDTGLPSDEGELVYSGPNVMMGYAEDADDLRRGPEVERLHTGDLAQKVGPSLFRITGRKSRFIKVFGLRIALDEVEREAAGNGWTIVATGTDEQLMLASEDEVTSGAPAYFARRYGIPETHITFVHHEAIPRLASGKIDYRAIIASVPARSSGIDSNSDRLEALLRLFAPAFPNRHIVETDSFLSLDGDSLSYISLSLGIEEITGALPAKWESYSIARLAEEGSRNRSRKRYFARVEVSVLVRAVAPIMIVSNHAGVDHVRGGAAILLVVAGLNFARFSCGDMAAGRFFKIISSLALNVLVPYWLVFLLFGALKNSLTWSELALVNNWMAIDSVSPFESWFVQVLVQAILLYVALAWIPLIRRLWRDNQFNISLLILIAAAMFAISHYLFWTNILSNGGRELTWQLWLFAAGVAVNYADTQARRASVLLVVVIVAIPLYGADASRLIAATGGTAALLWLHKVPVPIRALPAITVIGSASLFIYMMHSRAPVHSPTASWEVDIIRIVAGILIGIATWRGYEELNKIARRILRTRFSLFDNRQ